MNYRTSINPDYLFMKAGAITDEGKAVVMRGENGQPTEPLPDHADIFVEIAAGSWQVNGPGRYDIYDEFTNLPDKKVIVLSGLRINPKERAMVKTLIEATTTSLLVDIKLECITNEGKTHESWHERTFTSKDQLKQHTFGFTVLVDQIEKINVMYRPYHRVEFKNVSIKPGRNTDVQIEVYTDQHSSEGRQGRSGSDTKVLQMLEAERDAIRTRMDDYQITIHHIEQEYGGMKVWEGRQKMSLQRATGLLKRLTEQEAKRMDLEVQLKKVSKELPPGSEKLAELRSELEQSRVYEKRLQEAIDKEDIETVKTGRKMLELVDLEDRLSRTKERYDSILHRIRQLQSRQNGSVGQ